MHSVKNTIDGFVLGSLFSEERDVMSGNEGSQAEIKQTESFHNSPAKAFDENLE
jgi:hypothetical protein